MAADKAGGPGGGGGRPGNEANIVVIPGDFIGPEIVAETVKVLEAVGERFGHTFRFQEVLAGGAAFDEFGEHLPASTVDACRRADAVLKGPFGGPPSELNHPKWAKVEQEAILGLRRELNLYANLRPIVTREALLDFSPVRRERVENVDIMIVRELASGIYFGPKSRGVVDGEEQAVDTELYRASEIERIAKVAFDLARQRRRKVTLVAKSNVLISSVLWREVTGEVAKAYSDVELDYMHVDNASMQLIIDPRQFDVLLTTNMFGDILSDEAGAVAGSIGVLPSASMGDGGGLEGGGSGVGDDRFGDGGSGAGGRRFGLYEPIHGSAPDIAGQDKANPIGQILSGASLLRHSLGLEEEARAVEDAVDALLDEGYRTEDLAAGRTDVKLIGTKAVGDFVAERIVG